MDGQVISEVSDLLWESLTHTAMTVPLLFLVFLLVEALAHRTQSAWITRITGHTVTGPVAAACLGLLPQCGFSVAATTLYLENLIPAGSLIAAYIATSDEAIPILLSSRETVTWVMPLLATKLVWGTVAGIAINAATRRHGQYSPAKRGKESSPAGAPIQAASQKASTQHLLPDPHHRSCETRGFSGHLCVGEHAGPGTFFVHALSRTARIAAMVFVMSSALNLAGHLLEPRMTSALSLPGFWQNLAASLIGLIPTCATSVALAEGFRTGIVSFPALVSGLTSNAGVGLLVLATESRDMTKTLTIAGLLVTAALIAGALAVILM